MRVRHRIIPRFLERSDLGNGDTNEVRGVELEITSITKTDGGQDYLKIEGFWIGLHEAAELSTAINNVLIGKGS
jgi:hypothetical protein